MLIYCVKKSLPAAFKYKQFHMNDIGYYYISYLMLWKCSVLQINTPGLKVGFYTSDFVFTEAEKAAAAAVWAVEALTV